MATHDVVERRRRTIALLDDDIEAGKVDGVGVVVGQRLGLGSVIRVVVVMLVADGAVLVAVPAGVRD